MNLAAILALIGDLYTQVTQLQAANKELRDRLQSTESGQADAGGLPSPTAPLASDSTPTQMVG